jgi:hypothetical protein
MSYFRLGSLALSFLMLLTLTVALPTDVSARGRKGKAVRAAGRAGRGKKVGIARGRARGLRQTTRGSRRAVVVKRGRGGRKVYYVPAAASRVRRTSLAIPPERVREIQEALQRAGFLAAEPSGQYDKTTVEAMTNYQKSNNLRVTGYPTAESLQKLGLNKTRSDVPVVNSNSSDTQNDSQPPTDGNLRKLSANKLFSN